METLRYVIKQFMQVVLHWCLLTNAVYTLRPRQNGRNFLDDIFKCIILNENVSISIKISLKFVPKGPINNYPALIQIMAWRRSGDKPLSEPMMVSLLTHICVTQPQWVNSSLIIYLPQRIHRSNLCWFYHQPLLCSLPCKINQIVCLN